MTITPSLVTPMSSSSVSTPIERALAKDCRVFSGRRARPPRCASMSKEAGALEPELLSAATADTTDKLNSVSAREIEPKKRTRRSPSGTPAGERPDGAPSVRTKTNMKPRLRDEGPLQLARPDGGFQFLLHLGVAPVRAH